LGFADLVFGRLAHKLPKDFLEAQSFFSQGSHTAVGFRNTNNTPAALGVMVQQKTTTLALYGGDSWISSKRSSAGIELVAVAQVQQDALSLRGSLTESVDAFIEEATTAVDHDYP
jgi:hypothetical protein